MRKESASAKRRQHEHDRDQQSGAWQRNYNISVEIDLAKIIGILALFAMIALCAAGPSGARFPNGASIQTFWRLVLDAQPWDSAPDAGKKNAE